MTFDRNGPVLPLGRYCITTLATAAGMWKALIVRPMLVGLISCRPALPAAGECSTSKVPPTEEAVPIEVKEYDPRSSPARLTLNTPAPSAVAASVPTPATLMPVRPVEIG